MIKLLKKLDKPLLIASLILFVIGLIMIFSASNITAFMKYEQSPYQYFFKQIVILTLCLFIFIVAIHFNTKVYSAFSWPLLIIITALLFILLIYGELKNQSRSWFNFMGFGLQPSEFVKVIMIMWLASYYEVNSKKTDLYGVTIFPLIIAFVIAFLIALQPDLGTALIFMAIVGLIFLSSPTAKKIKNQICLVLLGLVAVVALFFISSDKSLLLNRQMERFNFTNPCSRFLDDGNQVCNGYIAINNGGLFGVGLGNSTQKYLYLPEAHTDFIFAIIVEELGLLVSIGILILFIIILLRIYKIARESSTIRGSIMCYGVFLLVLSHIIINLMGIMSLIPLTGVPLPFLSYGGSFTLTLVVGLSIVQRVSIENVLFKEKCKIK